MKTYKVKNDGAQFCECCGVSLLKRKMIWTNDVGDAACTEECLQALSNEDDTFTDEPLTEGELSQLSSSADAGIWGHV